MRVGAGDGLPRSSVVNLLDLRVVPVALLVEPITTLASDRMRDVCDALAFATGC